MSEYKKEYNPIVRIEVYVLNPDGSFYAQRKLSFQKIQLAKDWADAVEKEYKNEIVALKKQGIRTTSLPNRVRVYLYEISSNTLLEKTTKVL